MSRINKMVGKKLSNLDSLKNIGKNFGIGAAIGAPFKTGLNYVLGDETVSEHPYAHLAKNAITAGVLTALIAPFNRSKK